MALSTNVADQVLADLPRVQSALAMVHQQARSAVDADLLDLSEQRICQLLGAPAPEATIDMASSPLGVAVVAFVEQWVIDVASVSDEMVSALASHLGDDALMDFVHGVLAIEQRVRLGLAWQQLGLTV